MDIVLKWNINNNLSMVIAGRYSIAHARMRLVSNFLSLENNFHTSLSISNNEIKSNIFNNIGTYLKL